MIRQTPSGTTWEETTTQLTFKGLVPMSNAGDE